MEIRYRPWAGFVEKDYEKRNIYYSKWILIHVKKIGMQKFILRYNSRNIGNHSRLKLKMFVQKSVKVVYWIKVAQFICDVYDVGYMRFATRTLPEYSKLLPQWPLEFII